MADYLLGWLGTVQVLIEQVMVEEGLERDNTVSHHKIVGQIMPTWTRLGD